MEDFLDRLQKAHSLIKQEDTGTRKQFAKTLGISESGLWRTLKVFQRHDIPIKFSKRGKTYYYDIPKHQTVRLVWLLEIVDLDS
ncbi:MAG: hypothetical protein AAFO69_15650 [Bacteroidota bacterium]